MPERKMSAVSGHKFIEPALIRPNIEIDLLHVRSSVPAHVCSRRTSFIQLRRDAHGHRSRKL